ncbi:hypothetical protein I302_105721 [Kwoniella bestiolae CBS 10118]|uniref:Uncharacterized protein n=1 Tax=Kwoniella bestiolae CBS 10118 TaxID=1296100 RepID=A0A1B9G1Z2_9TREE|nr:hypothetical protein I302_04841 [Kwoniella bestiolae CBS 10118]OCF25031.1 hypothetical protein I302_04841 [Kwoniella bestiolae CBS 10118]
MADLTPPSSHNSTPVRPSADELPPSPTAGLGASRPHPLMKSTSMDVDVDDQEHLSDTDSDSEELGEFQDGALEEGEEIMGFSDEEEEEGQVHAASTGDGDGMGKGKVTDSGSRKGKQPRNRRTRKNQPRSAAGPLLSTSKLTRGGGGGKKDGDLWESEIVDRWNVEIGDVCSEDVVLISSTGPIASGQDQGQPVAH